MVRAHVGPLLTIKTLDLSRVFVFVVLNLVLKKGINFHYTSICFGESEIILETARYTVLPEFFVLFVNPSEFFEKLLSNQAI